MSIGRQGVSPGDLVKLPVKLPIHPPTNQQTNKPTNQQAWIEVAPMILTDSSDTP
jgi:hypothetical protein